MYACISTGQKHFPHLVFSTLSPTYDPRDPRGKTALTSLRWASLRLAIREVAHAKKPFIIYREQLGGFGALSALMQ